MDEMMVAIAGTVIVKFALIVAILEAAQYFHNQNLLWWWVLVLFADISYKRTVTNEETKAGKEGVDEG